MSFIISLLTLLPGVCGLHSWLWYWRSFCKSL